MTRVMMSCTYGGKPIFTGRDLPPDVDLSILGGDTIECPECHRVHPLRKLFFEGTVPTEKARYSVALESAPGFASDIGVLISCFALVESYIPRLLTKLIGIAYEDAYLISGRFQMGERVQLLCKLAERRPEGDATRIAVDRLSPRVLDAIAARNKYAHAQYSITFEDAVIVESWLHDSRRKTKPKSTEDRVFIGREIEKVQSLICDLHGFVYRDEMPPENETRSA